MNPTLQGIVFALLISLLIGVLLGLFLRQSRINELSQALKQARKREEEVAQEHEQRLQEATLQLQKDYEAQLAAKIERYQDQYEDQLAHMEQEYQGRVSLIQQGLQPPAGINPLTSSAAGQIMPLPTSTEGADTAAIEKRIKQQYEARLKEAAQKIQKAYEQHLREKLDAERLTLQQDYEQRLVQKVEHYEDQLAERLTQLEGERDLRQHALSLSPDTIPINVAAVDLTAQRAELENQFKAEYERKLAEKIEHYQNDLAQRVSELEQEYEARFNLMQTTQGPEALANQPDHDEKAQADLEAQLRQNYESQLSAAIARYQDELEQRTIAMEQEYATRLQAIEVAQPTAPEPVDAVLEETIRAQIEVQLQQEYETRLATSLEEYQNELAQQIQTMEQDFAARLAAVQAAQPPEAESTVDEAAIAAHYRQDYEARLAAAVERYQDQLVERTEAMERDYEARLQAIQAAQPPAGSMQPTAPVARESDLELEETNELEFIIEPEADNLELGTDEPWSLESDAPAIDQTWDLESSPPAPDLAAMSDLADLAEPDQSGNDFSLDELLTMDAEDGLDLGDSLDLEGTSPEQEDDFSLDNLDALLEGETADDETDDFLDGLDDLSKLS